ncbi:MAG: ubiquinone/menaquinone biosynthesis methyltransferase [Actinomycetota bacterium]
MRAGHDRRPSLPSGAEKARAVRSMFDAIAPRYDLLNRILSLGMDVGWRRRSVAALALPPGSVVVDVACGTGDLCNELERAGYRPVGVDYSPGMLAAAHTTAPLLLADALALPVAEGAADGITCGFALRNVIDLERLFAEMARVLRPGGRVSLLETAEPRGAIPRLVHHAYVNRVVPFIGGLLSDRKAYTYLPRSSAYLPSPEAMLGIIAAAGLTEVSRRLLGLGAAQLITGTRA